MGTFLISHFRVTNVTFINGKKSLNIAVSLCKFNNIFIYKITEKNSVAASERRNDHIQVYIIIMEGK